MKISATTFSKLLETSEKSFYRWKNKDHKILVNLIDKYFDEEDIKEFLKDKKINKFDKFENYINEKNKKIDLYLDFLSKIDTVINDVEEEESFINILINYNNEKSFLQNYIKNINDIETIFEEMIKYNMINIFEEIVTILNDTDLKILMERAPYMEGLQEKEALRYYVRYNIFKYKKDLQPLEKDDIYNSIINLHNDCPNNIFEANKLIFNEIEKLKNN